MKSFFSSNLLFAFSFSQIMTEFYISKGMSQFNLTRLFPSHQESEIKLQTLS